MKYFCILVSCLLLSSTLMQELHARGTETLPTKTARITIEKSDAGINDTLNLLFWKRILDETSVTSPDVILEVTPDENGVYSFQLPEIIIPGYFTVSSKKLVKPPYYRADLFDQWLIVPGDDVHVFMKRTRDTLQVPQFGSNDYQEVNLFENYSTRFEGRGAEHFTCYYETLKAGYGFRKSLTWIKDGKYIPGNGRDSAIVVCERILQAHRKNIDPFIYEVLKANVIGEHLRRKAVELNYSWALWAKDNPVRLASLKVLYNDHFSNVPDLVRSDSAKVYSRVYTSLIVSADAIKFYLENRIPFTSRFNYVNQKYDFLKSRYRGELRDKVLTSLFNLSFCSELMPSLEDALQLVGTDYCKVYLRSIYEGLATGKPAYKFTLSDTQGKQVSLEDFKGKIVFIDFWFTGCTSCSSYFQDQLSKVEEKFKSDPRIVFITISIDRDRDKWLQSVQGGKYTSRHSYNLYTDGLGGKHPIIRHYKIRGYPSPMIIDHRGDVYRIGGRDLRSADTLEQILLKAVSEIS